MKGGGRIIPKRDEEQEQGDKAAKFANRDNRTREQSNPKTLTSRRQPTGRPSVASNQVCQVMFCTFPIISK